MIGCYIKHFTWSVCLFCTTFLCIFSTAQNNKFPFSRFDHLSTEQGLSANNVYQVMQDNKGFIWLACGNGLNRFDGYNFKIFNRSSFSEGWFTGLKQDSKGIIWMSSANDGFYSFNPADEKFVHYHNNPEINNSLCDDIVNGFDIDKNGILWIGTETGLDAFNPCSKKFTHYHHAINNQSTVISNNIKSVGLDEDDNLWIVTVAAGVNCFNTVTGKVINHYSFNTNESFAGDEREVNYEINKGINGNMWFATLKEGLIGFNVKTKKIVQYLHDSQNINSISSNGVLSVYEDSNENLWIATDDGKLNYYNHKLKIFYHTDLLNITQSDVSQLGNIIADRSGKIWISSNHGIFSFNATQENFNCFQHNNNFNSVDDNTVGAFLHDSYGNFLIGASGIDYFNKSTGEFSRLKIIDKGKNILDNNSPANFHEDRKGNLMFALSNGLLFYNPQTKTQHYYKHEENDSTTFSEVSCNDVMEDSKGRYWATAWQGGLNAINTETGKIRAFKLHAGDNSISTNSVGGIFETANGNLLIGSQNGGLIIFNPDTEKFKIYKNVPGDSTSLSNNIAFNFFEEKNGIIWLGTRGGGINAFNPQTGKFRAFTTKDGLCNDAIFCMTKDNNNNMWIGTGNGISCFMPPQNPFDYTSKFRFRNYDKSDGLPGNVMNFFAAYKDTDGCIYFGTVNTGFFYFNPDSLKDNQYVPPVYITDFSLFNKSISLNDTTHLLSSSIERTKEIKLNYNQNIISFSFAALNYIHPEKNKYAYKLEGFDKDWVYVDATKRVATYTNLDARNYVFKVRASNNDGIWNEQEASLKLIIAPPYWQTWWFTCLLAIAVAIFIYSLYRFRIKQILKFQAIRNKIAGDLHDDIGSTLNSISVYSEVARLDEANRDEALEMIGDSSRKIIDSLSDIVWTINPTYDSFSKLILRMRSLSYNLFRAKKIEFTFRADEKFDELKLSMMERQNFYLIFKEAINNVIKYSKATRANIQLTFTNNFIELLIRDNGIGFNVDEYTDGNGLGNIKRRAKEMNAQIQINSEPGNGTIIRVTMKK